MTRHRLAVRVAAAAMVLAPLGGCASTQPLGGAPDQGLQVVSMAEMPPPEGIMVGTDDRPYLLGPGDEILVDVVGIEELTKREFSLDGAGTVSIPLAGSLNAKGKTAEQLGNDLKDRLRANYVRDPLVTVNLNAARSRFVTVDGRVNKPGAYPVVGRMTLMEAVARAEGVEELAKLNDVVIFRTVGSAQMVALYDLGAIRRGAYANPEVFPGDVVVVGEARGRRMFQQILQAGTLLVSPIVALLQR